MNLDWLRNRPIAHRGLHSNDSRVPENSLAAFQLAIKNNYPIEIDAHLLSDNKIVVFHDYDLIRMYGKKMYINKLNSQSIREYKLLNSNQKIPLLDEVFDLVKGRVPILIEIKDQPRNKMIQEVLLKKIVSYKGEIAVQSFNPFLLRLFSKKAPNIPRGQLSSMFKSEKISILKRLILKNYILNFISRPHFIGHNIDDMTNSTVEKLKNKGLIVLCWTITKNTKYKHLTKYFDNIIFEGFKP